MISIAELQLLACLVCGIVFAGFVFYWIRKKRRENKVKTQLIFVLPDLSIFMSDKSDMIHTKECTYRNNHDFRHDNCFCTCHPKNEKKKGNLKPELRKNME